MARSDRIRGILGRRAELYYEDSGFFNYGYWEPGIDSQPAACENLVNKLLDFIPNKQGRILDVGCGLGATTRTLLRYYAPANVVGINIDEKQLTTARQNAPGCTFLLMDATSLKFDDASFENIICVEAAFRFNTMDDFFREAFRVLKPGGRLVLCDILLDKPKTGVQTRLRILAGNYVADLESYRRRFEAVGFTQVQVVDATEACWGGFRRNMRRWPWQAWRKGQLSAREYIQAAISFRLTTVALGRAIRYYPLAMAVKPT